MYYDCRIVFLPFQCQINDYKLNVTFTLNIFNLQFMICLTVNNVVTEQKKVNHILIREAKR